MDGELDLSSTPRQLAKSTSPWGLTGHEASRRLISAVEGELRQAELASAKSLSTYPDLTPLLLFPRLAARLNYRLQYFCTEDGFIGSVCVLVLAVAAIISKIHPSEAEEHVNDYMVTPRGAVTRAYLADIIIFTPFILINAWLHGVSRKVERIRAFAQLREAIQLYEKSIGARKTTMKSHKALPAFHLASEHEVPSCALGSVLREGEWRRLPFNLIVRGDVIKLRQGDVAPCNVIGVTLRSVGKKGRASEEDDDVTMPDSYEFDFDGRQLAKGETCVEPVKSPHCPPQLCAGIYVAQETPSVAQVKRFLQVSGRTASPSTSKPAHSRLDSPFTAIAETMYCDTLRPWYAILVLSLLLNTVVRLTIASVRGFDQHSTGALARPYESATTFRLLLMSAPLAALVSSPVVTRLILHLTDLWGNARLQSLFLYHHERRYASTEAPVDLATPRDLSTPKHSVSTVHESQSSPLDSSTSKSSVISETGLSRPSSAESEVSVSRVPLRTQLREIINIFHQGLDGRNNLLHALNSTTYLCFVDTDGLLTETCRSIREVCFLESGETDDDLLSDARHSDLATVSFLPDITDVVRSSTLPATDLDRKAHSGPTEASDDDENYSRMKKVEEIRPVVLQVTTTEFDEGFYRKLESESSYSNSERSPFSQGGLRFVDEQEALKYMPLIRPLALAMRKTYIPPIHMMRGASVGWLHTQRMHDIFQREQKTVAHWAECLCGLSKLTDMPATEVLASINPVRHALICDLASCPVDTSPVSTPSPRTSFGTSTPSDSDSYFDITLPDAPRFGETEKIRTLIDMRWLLAVITKDSRNDSAQLLVKGRPDDLVKKCAVCYDGKHIIPMTENIHKKLASVLMQWKSEGFDVFAFAFTPLSESQQKFLLHALEEQTIFHTRRHPDNQRRSWRSGGKQTSSFSDVWRPMVAFPGPRSVQLRPEPFVFPRRLLSESAEDSVTPGLALLNYDNRLLSVKKWISKPQRRRSYRGGGMATIKSDSDLSHSTADRIPTAQSHQNISKLPIPRALSFFRKASWLPMRTAALGSDLLKQLTDQSLIFTGLAAMQTKTPPAVPERIGDFQSAGVRFSLFSSSDIISTRQLGSVLGLETGWNSVVSLEESDKDAIFVNQEGNEVLPAGIDKIKKHVKDIDDIPLLVSLYANCTPPTILQMIKMLQKRNEIVTCVGSALRTSNFDVFTEASCPVSILSLPFPLCYHCHGRRNVGGSGSFYTPVLLPELSFSAALTSLPCALQSHAVSFQFHNCHQGTAEMVKADDPRNESYPEFLLELLYSSFQEARRIVSSIEMIVTYLTVVTSGLVGGVFFIQSMLTFPAILSDLDLLLLLCILLPIPAISLACNPVREDSMVEFPRHLSPDTRNRAMRRRHILPRRERLSNASSGSSLMDDVSTPKPRLYETRILLQMCRLVVPIIAVVVLSLAFSRYQLITASNQVLAETENATVREEIDLMCYRSFTIPKSFLDGKWCRCTMAISDGLRTLKESDASRNAQADAVLHAATTIVLLVHSFALSLSAIDKFESIIHTPPWKNKLLFVAWLVVAACYVLSTAVRLGAFKGAVTWSLPGWIWWLCVMVSGCVTLLVSEIVKGFEKKRHAREQKFLRLLFHTRLGMWSPK